WRVRRAGQRPWFQPLRAKVGNLDVVEQAAIAGALAGGLLDNPHRAIDAAHRIAERLNRLVDEAEGQWQGEFNAKDGLVLSRTTRGVGERRVIDRMLLGSSEARRLDGDGAAVGQ